MRKFLDFSISQILREINLGDSRSAKSAILTHLEAMNFEFLHFLKAETHQIRKYLSPINSKKFKILESWFHVKSEWQKILKIPHCAYVRLGTSSPNKILPRWCAHSRSQFYVIPSMFNDVHPSVRQFVRPTDVHFQEKLHTPPRSIIPISQEPRLFTRRPKSEPWRMGGPDPVIYFS